MFIRIKKSASRKTAVQLVEGSRDAISGKVKQRVVRHIGYAANDEEIANLKQLANHLKNELEEQSQPSLFAPEILTIQRKQEHDDDYKIDDMRKLRTQNQIITGVHDVYGPIFDKLGFSSILSNPARKVHSQKILRDIVLARIANPDSKRSSVGFLAQKCGINLKLDSVYKAMDYLDDKAIERIQNRSLTAAQTLFKENINVLFYDATTLYFESFTEDDLKSKGFSKDHKSQEVQVLLSIFVTQHGIPVGYDLFPGSTYEGYTLISALDNLRQRFAINNVVFVADSGMLQKDNLELLEAHGYQYIVGARLKNMSKSITEQILSRDGRINIICDEEQQEGKLIKLDDDRTLVVTHSFKRARKDAHDRNTAISKLQKKLKKSKSVKSMVSNSGYKKYLHLTGDSLITLDQDKIDEAQKWDGLHGLITNIPDVNIAEVIKHYRGLWQVEETFRVSKHDLKVRPIYHWNQERIKAHIALCFMALVCVRHMEYRLKISNKKMSPKKIKDALSTVGITTLVHMEDKRVFAVPFNASEDAKTIYKINNIKLLNTPFLM